MTTTEIVTLIGVCGSTLVGLGGIAVAYLSFRLNYNARMAHYHHQLYERQFDAYVELFQAMSRWHNVAQSYLCEIRHVLRTDEQRINLRLASKDLHIAAAEVYTKWMLFLPAEVNDAYKSFQNVFNAISAPSQVAKSYSPMLVNSNDPGMDLSRAFVAFVNTTRRHIGTECLTKDFRDALDPTYSDKQRND